MCVAFSIHVPEVRVINEKAPYRRRASSAPNSRREVSIVKRVFAAVISVLAGVAVVAGVAIFASVTKGTPPVLAATPTGMVDTPTGPMNSAYLEVRRMCLKCPSHCT